MSHLRAQSTLDLNAVGDLGSLLRAILQGVAKLVATIALDNHTVHWEAC